MTATRVALLLYCLLAVVQIRQKPGLQYDEALPVMGSVHLRDHPREDFTLPHDPDTWIQIRTRWLPLMTVRYVGAVKEYVWLPLLKLLGPSTASIRALAALFGLIGIWGIAAWLRGNAGARAAGITALLLAVNPSYVDMTVFDNGTVSVFMAALGLMCAAIAYYQTHPGAPAAALAGFTMGFGVWARVNFIWVVAATIVAAAVVLHRKLLRIPVSHWSAAAGGGLMGCAPLILYQVISHGGTFEAVGMFSANDTLGTRLFTRLVMFSESLICDREHRVMWDGPAMSLWQPVLFGLIVLTACGVCLRAPGVRRVIAIAFLIFAACLFFSGLPVAEHHLVTLLPFAAAMVTLAALALVERYARARWPAIALAIVYAGCAFGWQTAAVAGLKRTGGANVWSDGIVALATRLESDYPQTEVKFLDWGFQQNIYVITNGRLHTREIYGDSTPEKSGLGRPWMEELRAGGVFVFFAPDLRQMPAATNAFLAAIREGTPVTRRFSVPRRDGAPYAEVVEVVPDTLHRAASARLATGDPGVADRLEGFYDIESGWRWSRKDFAITLGAPPLAGVQTARLSVDIFLPDSLLQPLHSMTVSAQVNGHAIPPETYRQPGSYTYGRDLPVAWLKEGPNRIEFSLDKSLAVDGRDLGVVVSSASLEAAK